MPPVGSTDHLNYASYGRMAATGHDPYRTSADDLPKDPVAGAPEEWRTTPSVYGPIATGGQAFAAWLGSGSVRLTVFVLSVLNTVAFAATSLILYRTSRSEERRLRTALLWTCNPLVLFHLIAGAHNDVLAIAPMVAALAVAGGRTSWARGLAARRAGRHRHGDQAARRPRRGRPRLGAAPRDLDRAPVAADRGAGRARGGRRGRHGAVVRARRPARPRPGPRGEQHGVVRDALASGGRVARPRLAARRHQARRDAPRHGAVPAAVPRPAEGRPVTGRGGDVAGRREPPRRRRDRPRVAPRRPLRAALVRRLRLGAAGAAAVDADRLDPARAHRRAQPRLPAGPRARPDPAAGRPGVAVHRRSADRRSVDAAGDPDGPGGGVSAFLRSISSDRSPAASISGVARLNDTDRITTPESFTSVPMTPTVSAQISAGRIVRLCS
ncbi:polyprenol phosphomannose-dependent alpha 1,6 mannosyltransferase MptB [Actinomadura madurae]|nr:polyprenol phosphomannose-dependent alpha 1,6 mannosyltransferase MptB [Actinomadura madurae]